MATFIGIVHKDEHSDYGVSFPDFPGCVTASASIDELQSLAEEALALHIEGMKEDGETIPVPMAFDRARAHKMAEGASALLIVRAALPGKPTRINIMMDSGLVEEIDRVAPNRSAFIATAARHELAQQRLTSRVIFESGEDVGPCSTRPGEIKRRQVIVGPMGGKAARARRSRADAS